MGQLKWSVALVLLFAQFFVLIESQNEEWATSNNEYVNWRALDQTNAKYSQDELAQILTNCAPKVDDYGAASIIQPDIAGKRTTNGIDRFIIGGSYAVAGQFPWQAFLKIQLNATYINLCGGSLILADWILTAAHCIQLSVPTANHSVLLGSVNWQKTTAGSVVRRAIKIFVHEGYSSVTKNNDIALIQIQAVDFTANIRPVALPPLPDVNNTFEGVKATVSGFGRVSQTSSPSTTLKYTTLSVIPNSVCIRHYGPYSFVSSNLCVQDLTNSSAHCKGDSGGPLVYQNLESTWVQIGIVSYSTKDSCLGYPLVYARVSSFLGWISSKINSMEQTTTTINIPISTTSTSTISTKPNTTTALPITTTTKPTTLTASQITTIANPNIITTTPTSTTFSSTITTITTPITTTTIVTKPTTTNTTPNTETTTKQTTTKATSNSITTTISTPSTAPTFSTTTTASTAKSTTITATPTITSTTTITPTSTAKISTTTLTSTTTITPTSTSKISTTTTTLTSTPTIRSTTTVTPTPTSTTKSSTATITTTSTNAPSTTTLKLTTTTTPKPTPVNTVTSTTNTKQSSTTSTIISSSTTRPTTTLKPPMCSSFYFSTLGSDCCLLPPTYLIAPWAIYPSVCGETRLTLPFVWNTFNYYTLNKWQDVGNVPANSINFNDPVFLSTLGKTACFVNCYLRYNGILKTVGNENQINEQLLINFLSQPQRHNYWKNVISSAVSECLLIVKKMSIPNFIASRPYESCDGTALLALQCVQFKMLKSCDGQSKPNLICSLRYDRFNSCAANLF